MTKFLLFKTTGKKNNIQLLFLPCCLFRSASSRSELCERHKASSILAANPVFMAVFLRFEKSSVPHKLIYSKQGYDYKNGTNTEVSLDYIMMPQYMTINITKYLQIN
jgi:hypothetical protein